MQRATLSALTRVYFKTGNTTFGGGDPTMAALERELVEKRGWLSRDDFSLAYSLARITPGTNVLAFCAATAERISGIRGAIPAVLAVTLPTATIAVAITYAYELCERIASRCRDWRIGRGGCRDDYSRRRGRLMRPQKKLRSILITSAAFLCAWRFTLSPIAILAAAAAVGFAWRETGTK